MSEPMEFATCKNFESFEKLGRLDDWVMEPKLDGIRIQLHITADRVETWTRAGNAKHGALIAVETALQPYLKEFDGTVLDGEAVYIDVDTGLADFNWTARVMGSHTPTAIQKQRQAGKLLSYVAFDILALQGHDVRHLPLKDRRILLERFVDGIDELFLVYTEQVEPTIDNHVLFTERYGEGSVIKDLRERYIGKRSKAMLKWKKQDTEDVVITGFTPGQGKYADLIGAVKFGQYRDGELVERGQCSGMTDAVREEMALNQRDFIGMAMEITHNGVLVDGFRHPQFFRLRNDKPAEQCTWT